MKYIFVLSVVVLVSCKRDEVTLPSFSEARYSIAITGKWSSPAFSVPTNAHYTTCFGMIHNSSAFLWKEGEKASAGTEQMAETGAIAGMIREVDSVIATKNAISVILFYGPAPTGINTANFSCNSNFSRISFGSMLGPTPDWFIGLSGFDLYPGNKWISDTTINLYALDAGTEDGDMFGYNNPATVPQQNIRRLQAPEATVLANGNSALSPIATIRFTRQQ